MYAISSGQVPAALYSRLAVEESGRKSEQQHVMPAGVVAGSRPKARVQPAARREGSTRPAGAWAMAARATAASRGRRKRAGRGCGRCAAAWLPCSWRGWREKCGERAGRCLVSSRNTGTWRRCDGCRGGSGRLRDCSPIASARQARQRLRRPLLSSGPSGDTGLPRLELLSLSLRTGSGTRGGWPSTHKPFTGSEDA